MVSPFCLKKHFPYAVAFRHHFTKLIGSVSMSRDFWRLCAWKWFFGWRSSQGTYVHCEQRRSVLPQRSLIALCLCDVTDLRTAISRSYWWRDLKILWHKLFTTGYLVLCDNIAHIWIWQLPDYIILHLILPVKLWLISIISKDMFHIHSFSVVVCTWSICRLLYILDSSTKVQSYGQFRHRKHVPF